MRINFEYLMDGSSGYVELVDGKLVGSDETHQFLADEWTGDGGSVDEFIAHYTKWSNGYVASELARDTPEV